MSASTPTGAPTRERRHDEDESASGRPLRLAILAWFIPGAGHLMLGQFSKSAIFFVVLTTMFVLGCGFDGRLFPFQTSEWLVVLAALAQWGLGLPRLIGAVTGFGVGDVTAITYEYGNTFLMAAGLLNALVVVNVFDLARGRDTR